MKISRYTFWASIGCFVIGAVHIIAGQPDWATSALMLGFVGPAIEIMEQMGGRK